MPKDYKNNKFKIIELNQLEIDILAWGHKCDSCNKELSKLNDKSYFIPALHQCFCKECCDDIIKNLDAKLTDKEKTLENALYNKVMNNLDIDNILKDIEADRAEMENATIEAHDIDNL